MQEAIDESMTTQARCGFTNTETLPSALATKMNILHVNNVPGQRAGLIRGFQSGDPSCPQLTRGLRNAQTSGFYSD